MCLRYVDLDRKCNVFHQFFLFAKENKEVQFQNVEKSVGKFFTFMSFSARFDVFRDERSFETFKPRLH